jgi:hypothetical protein
MSGADVPADSAAPAPVAPQPANPIQPLRYGLLLDGTRLHRWQYAMLERLAAEPGVELALVVLNTTPGEPRWKKLLHKLRPTHALYQWHLRRGGYPQQMEHVDAAPLLGAAESQRCTVTRHGFANYFDGKDIAAIKNRQVDFLLRFGFGIIRGPILKATRYGVWSCHMMDEQKFRGQPMAYWECYFGEQRAACFLQRLTSRLDGGVILKKRWVELAGRSIKQSMDDLLKALVDLPAEVCREIRAGRADYLDAAPVKTSARVYRLPTNLQMLRIMANERKRVAATRSASPGNQPVGRPHGG